MQYYTNQELAESNHVSVRTVRNWIEAAREGKLELTLHEKGQRHYIANTSKNTLIIKDLVNKNKKYRPHRSQRTVMPQSKFYDLYTQEQLYDLVSNLEINHEIPRQYNYLGDGATNWNNYANRLYEEDSANTLKATIDLLRENTEYIDYILENYEQVNVIDVGVGNALPSRGFIQHLLDNGKLGRYIAIDISPTMLEIAEANIRKWFNGAVTFEGHALDIDQTRFGNLMAEEYIKSNAEKTSNVLLFLGGTLGNFKRPASALKVIHDSMGVNDFLIHSQWLDTSSRRRYFDFNPPATSTGLAPNHRYIFDLLNIDDSLYEVKMGYDTDLEERFIRVVLKVSLSIRFMFKGGERIISFNKGDEIQLWRGRQMDMLKMVKLFTENEFYPLHVTETRDQEFVVTISRIKPDQS
jgi:uncharacterized SAM-dependent methyltransferase